MAYRRYKQIAPDTVFPPIAQDVEGLGVVPAGTFFATDSGFVYTIDPNTLVATLIGNGAAAETLAFDTTGTLYSHDFGGQLFSTQLDPFGDTFVVDTASSIASSAIIFASPPCFDVESDEVNCHADGSLFSWALQGVNPCTGVTMSLVFTGSTDTPGEDFCVTIVMNNAEGGLCCETTLCTIVPNCGGAPSGDVLIAASASSGQPWIDDVKEKIESTGMVPGNIDTMDIALGIPSLSDLLNYGAVLVFTDSPGAADPIGFGDNLADYVDAGGGVVLQTFYWNLGNGGRFITDGYSPLNTGGQTQNNPMGIGTIHKPGHPVLAGVVSFDGGTSSYHNIGDVAPGAIAIADWEDGLPFAAEMPGFDGRIIGLNFFAPSIDVRDDFWDTASDGALLMANAVNHVMATGVAACPGDLNADGVVGINDFIDLLSQWGTDPGDPPDFDGNGTVDVVDMLALLSVWGVCP